MISTSYFEVVQQLLSMCTCCDQIFSFHRLVLCRTHPVDPLFKFSTSLTKQRFLNRPLKEIERALCLLPLCCVIIEAKQEDEQVSLEQVNELLSKQKEMFVALLQQQQDNFQCFAKMILDSTNQRLDTLTREVQEIKTSIQFTQKEVDDIKISNTDQADHGKALQVDIMKICDSLLVLTDKLEYLEGQSRRNNLVIDGIIETPGETWTEAEEKVKKIFAEKLQLQRSIEVERAHRTGKPLMGERPRPIVVQFLTHKDRSAVLQRAKNLKGTKIFINEDYTDTVRQKRKELIPKMRAAQERGGIAFLRYDKLVIHPRSSTPKPSVET